MTVRLPIVVDDHVSLVLADDSVAEAYRDLVLADLDHLRPWEELARPDLTTEDVLTYLTPGLTGWAEGTGVPTAIVLDGAVVGALVARITPATAKAEVGYWLASGAAGRGVMTRAVEALLDALFDDGVFRVELRTAADNLPSRAVAERLGFTLEGTLRQAYPIEGVRHDLCVYARLATDPAR
ncbi:GNAT family N-acetyltransferase [Curtobacterium sp. NPDC089689]|uniref:GNAT family N-acetyltransferase n=1 Tax=Curtobacterium sp. NPDC089689 TaxID=3363968 RepID=UPI0038200376